MIASLKNSPDAVQIKIHPMLFRVAGILAFLAFLPLLLVFGWNQGLGVLGVPPITYFNACAMLSLVVFVMLIVVCTVIIIKELV